MGEEERHFVIPKKDKTPEGGQDRVTELLNNFVFQRFSRGFEIYQEIILQFKTEDKDFSEIKSRMLRVWNTLCSFLYQEKGYEFKKIMEGQIEKCESGSFEADELATELVALRMDGGLFAETPHSEGDKIDEYTIHVNEVVSYTWAVETRVKLDVATANFSSGEVFTKVIEGFKKVADLLKNGEMKNVRIVQMTSWLLSKDFEPKILELFSKIPAESLNFEEDDDYGPAQDLALNFNARSLQKFLLTGEKPKTRHLEISKEDFIRNFES